MLDQLVDLCEGTIHALIMLKSNNLISEIELESHMEKKLEFLNAFKLNYV